MAQKSILIIDDEPDLLEIIEYNLVKEGFRVFKTEDGAAGIEMARDAKPDLILLDLMMPGMNGYEVCEAIREDDAIKKIPIIFLTAKDDESSEIEGLNKGADDYITKPISTVKLISRVKAVLRRYEQMDEETDRIYVHDLEINRDRYVVIRDGEEYQLPRKEFELLYYLASRKGKVMDRQTLLNRVWGDNIYVVDRTVDVHVRKIREKLGDHYIETVKGVGYRFKE